MRSKNRGEYMEEGKEALKRVAKKAAKHFIRILLPVILVVSVIIVLLAAATYFIFVWVDGIGEDDWSNPSYAAGYYRNGVTVNSDGTLSSGTSSQDLWDRMLENGSRVDEYLDTPEELARLMKAEIVTQYPDTRSNPEEEINWDDIVNSDTIQGIIKFKRADSDGNISTLTYVDETTFNDWVKNGDKQALEHFTLKKSRGSTSINYNGPDLCWPVEPQFTAITSYFGYRGDIGVPGASSDHGGIDIGDAGIDGTNTYACESGTVTQATNSGDYNGGAGNWVVIDHGNGYVTKYMHMQTGSVTVQVGDTVTKGQVIGFVGTTGASSGPHCHFQIEYNGEKIDPLSFKYNNGMGEGTGGFGASSTNDEADENDGSRASSTNDEANNNNSNQSTGTRQGGATSVNGDGYSEEYTSSAGITYKDYKQYIGSYASNPYWGGTMQNSGCGPTAVAILASGLTNLNYTPADVASEMDFTGTATLKEEMDSLGMTSEIISNPSGDDIINNLENGKVMLVGVNPGTFTSSGHWMAIVDVNSAGEVYVCNPGSSSLYGWYDANFIAGETSNIIVTDAGATGVASSSNSSSYTAVVATWRQVDTTVTTNDPNVETKNDTKYTMTTTPINYEEMVEPYTMPFDLLWALLVEGEDKDFVFEIADLVYGSDIEMTVYDNLRVDTDVNEWHYTQRTKDEVSGTITATCNGESETGTIQRHEHEHDTTYQTTKTVVTQTNKVNAVLTRANVWIVDYQNDYTYVAPTETSIPSTVTKPNEDYPSSPDSTGNSYSCQEINNEKDRLKSIVIERAQRNNANSANPDEASSYDPTAPLEPNTQNYTVTFNESINVKYYNKYINITDNITNTVSTQKYIEGVPVRDLDKKTDPNSNEDNFVTIFNKSKYRKNKSNILNTTSWFFEILENKDSTKNMVELMKYLFYKATGHSYGVTEFDFDDLLNMNSSSSSGQISGDTVAEQVWNYFRSAGFSEESTAGIMGNFYQESGMDPTIDGGAAAGICMFEKSTGCFAAYQAYANSRGKEWTDLQSQLDYLMTQLPSTFNTYTGLSPYYYGTGEWCWWPEEMTVDEFKTISDVDKATEIFERVYERASLPMMERRKNAAQDYYSLYHGK